MCNVASFVFFAWIAYATAQSPQQHLILKSLLGLAVGGSAICYLIIAFSRAQNFAGDISKSSSHSMPKEIKTLEEWTEAGKHLQEINNRNFTHEEVVIDGKSFNSCTFKHVNIFYSGTAPTALINCTFDEDTRGHFHTRSPAIAQWTELLRNMGMLRADLKHAETPLE